MLYFKRVTYISYVFNRYYRIHVLSLSSNLEKKFREIVFLET